MTRSSKDETTDRRLRPLVGLVVSAASGVLAWALVALLRQDQAQLSLSTIGTLVFLTTVGGLALARVRVRATHVSTSWTDSAILIALFVVSAPWVIVTSALAAIITNGVLRLPPIKFAFGVAKTVLNAAAGATMLSVLDLRPLEAPHLEHVWRLVAIFLVMAVVDELLVIPIIAIATRTRIRDGFLLNLDIRSMSLVARFSAAAVTLAFLTVDSRLLVAVPPLVLSTHLWYSNRLRGRSERAAWQRLAGATEALNDVDLGTVLRLGVTHAANLFSADKVDVVYRLAAEHRLVRGDAEGIEYDGPPDSAPLDDTVPITVPLLGTDDHIDVGVLRLRFRGAVVLSERERYTLRTFASALCTAIRNASAYAELERVAGDHAHAAAHDALTGLTNRRALLDRGADLLSRRNTDGVLALLLIDLNHFKEVNDTLGHTAGDRVLVSVAERLRATAGPDDVVARLGGDEFAILLIGLPAPAVAAHRADTLLAALYHPIELDGMRISVEASGGIAQATAAGGMIEMLRRADVAMYQAKRVGQRLATYTRATDTADVGRLTVGGDLSQVIAEHQFAVDFQPIVDLASGEVIAAEALPRWQHPQRGPLDPPSLTEAVERSGLLPAFADAVLDLALVAAGTWREAGFDVPVSVNVSPRSLLDPRFPGTVIARLRAHDLPADRLVLELTETLTISQLEVVDQVLGQLRNAGVRLALDDFGTGYSSLSVLSRVPVHQLKIDREFVRTMSASAEAAAVVRSTVDLGRGLSLVVVADGVESEPQRRTLWELGCAAGQGRLFARPMAPGRLLAALHRGSDGRPGTLAPPLHSEGSVIRIPASRRPGGRTRAERLPHLPA